MEIEEIKKIVLKEGDVLAIRLPDETQNMHIENIQRNLKTIFPDNRCIIYIGEIEFTNLGPEGETE